MTEVLSKICLFHSPPKGLAKLTGFILHSGPCYGGTINRTKKDRYQRLVAVRVRRCIDRDVIILCLNLRRLRYYKDDISISPEDSLPSLCMPFG